MSNAGSILDVRHVAKSFGGVVAVRDASLSVEEGTITALIGPNGAGKTTLFNIVARSLAADAGEVWFRGQRIDRRPAHMVARSGLVRTFQQTRVLSRLTVLENVMVAAPDQAGEHFLHALVRRRAVRRAEAQLRVRASEMLEAIGLAQKADDYAAELSGGQRKLLEFGRALMTDPKLVLLDEPMAGVNPSLGRQLLDYVKQLCRDRGMTFLYVEHNMEVVMSVSDRVIVMAEGQVICEGVPADVRADPLVIDAYLGTSNPDDRTPDAERI